MFNTTNMPFETGILRKILQEVCIEFKILGIQEMHTYFMRSNQTFRACSSKDPLLRWFGI